MTEAFQSASAHFLDEVAASVRAGLANLDRHEAALATGPGNPAANESRWAAALGRLEGSFDDWQGMLGRLAEPVRAAFDDFAGLDAELRQSLDAVAAARKYLQGAGSRAAEGSLP